MNTQNKPGTEQFSRLGWLQGIHRGPKIGHSDYRVLVEISNRTRSDGKSGRVSRETLMKRSAVSVDTAKRAVSKLKALGYVVVTDRGSNLSQTANTYRLGSPTLGEDLRPPVEWVDPELVDVFPKLRYLDSIHLGPELRSAEYRVLVEILNSTTVEGGGAQVSIAELQRIAAMSKACVETAMSHLRSTGWIESDSVSGCTSTHRLLLPPGLLQPSVLVDSVSSQQFVGAATL